MKERELGTMQIANERIRIVETIAPFQNGSVLWGRGLPPLFSDHAEMAGIESRWQTLVKDDEQSLTKGIGEPFIAAEGTLSYVDSNVETVGLLVHVVEKYRRLGIGRLMIRLGTDQAIHYRKRTILAEVENTNEVALRILEDEEFEKQPEQHPGFTLMKKELNWV